MTACATVSAAELLHEARGRAYRWPVGFRGFAAQLRMRTESRAVGGMIWFTGARNLTLDLDDDAGEREWEWGIEQLRSLVVHRWPMVDEGECLTFPTRYDDASVGTVSASVVLVEDPMRSTYRIQQGQIVAIARQLPSLRLRVLIREQVPAPDGRWLPRHSTVVLSDLRGTVREVDIVTDTWAADAGLVWPTRREVVAVGGCHAVVRSLELSGHRRLDAVPRADAIPFGSIAGSATAEDVPLPRRALG